MFSFAQLWLKICFKSFTKEFLSAISIEIDAEGIWERLQARGLVPETFDFFEYSKIDESIVAHEAVTESVCQTVAKTVQEESNNNDDGSNTVEALLTPVEALTSIRQLEQYLHCHDDSEEMLHLLAKIQNYVVRKSISKPKQLKINDLFAKK